MAEACPKPCEFESILAQIVGLLELNWRFPKYGLERRLDIFILAFLAEYLSSKGEKAAFVAPEFPLLNPPVKLRDGKSKQFLLSTNIDYLFYRESPKPAWLFLELKTTSRSLDAKQLKRFTQAKMEGMKKVIADIELIRAGADRESNLKYEFLLEELRSKRFDVEAPIELIWLCPGKPRAPFDVAASVRWISMADLAEWKSERFPQAWRLVSQLLGRLS